MKSVKSFAVILMALLMLTVNVLASDVLVPNEVIMGTADNYKIIEKVYVLPKGSDEILIPKEMFGDEFAALNQVYQRELSLYFTPTYLQSEEILKKIKS